jgi:hypothetical protein
MAGLRERREKERERERGKQNKYSRTGQGIMKTVDLGSSVTDYN